MKRSNHMKQLSTPEYIFIMLGTTALGAVVFRNWNFFVFGFVLMLALALAMILSAVTKNDYVLTTVSNCGFITGLLAVIFKQDSIFSATNSVISLLIFIYTFIDIIYRFKSFAAKILNGNFKARIRGKILVGVLDFAILLVIYVIFTKVFVPQWPTIVEEI